MDDTLLTLKIGLAKRLEKQGSSLAEFEQTLANINTAEGVIKVANILESLADMGGSAVKAVGGAAARLPEIGLLSALLTGSIAGTGAYAIDNHLGNQDKKLNEKKQESDRVRMLTERLRQDHGLM